MKDRPRRSDVRLAAVVAWLWFALMVVVVLCSGAAHGADAVTAAKLQRAVCRIHNQLTGFNNIGSGTLIDKTDDSREGLVLTCAHLFREGVGNVVVEFANGTTHGAKLIDIDRQADLAALAIANPTRRPAMVSFTIGQQSLLHACGYGPRGVYRCGTGPGVGQVAGPGQLSLLIADSVRSGDSGGGVFDEQGRLVAVIWGTRDGVTYASTGRPFRRFVRRILGTRMRTDCPTGRCPFQEGGRRRAEGGRPDKKRRPLGPRSDAGSNYDALARRIDALEQNKQDRGDYLTRGDLPDLGGYVHQEEMHRLEQKSAQRHESLLKRLGALTSGASLGRKAGTAAVTALGISGPAGWAMIAAGTVGGWLIGRQIKRRGAGGRRRHGFPG